MTIIKIYRNLPLIDQVKTASIIKRLFPFYFKASKGFYNTYITIELPFIGLEIVNKKPIK